MRDVCGMSKLDDENSEDVYGRVGMCVKWKGINGGDDKMCHSEMICTPGNNGWEWFDKDRHTWVICDVECKDSSL